MKCLVVDPSPTMTRIIQNILRAAGGEDMLSARDTAGALELFDGGKGASLDLIVTERDLPGGSGLDLVSALRAVEGLATTPAIMVSSRNSRQDVLDAIQAGIDAYVLKPLNQEALLQRATALFEARRAAAEEPAATAGDAVPDVEASEDAPPVETPKTAAPAGDEPEAGLTADAAPEVEASGDASVPPEDEPEEQKAA
jgi:two-component system chemotaxis response regulator CheY